MKRLALIAGVCLLGSGMVLGQNPVADEKAQAPQSHDNQGQPITGKTQPNSGAIETPVTTTGSVGKTTPGAQTEAGVEQQPGGNSDVHHTGSAVPKAANSKTALPPNPNAAGQAPSEADRNAQAASRAEMEPNRTLGVNGTTNSTSNTGSATRAQAADLPQTDQTTHSKRAKKAGTKKAGAKNTHKKSTDKTATSQPQ